MAKNGFCKELLSNSSTKENCCYNRNVATAWSSEEYDEGTIFFWTRLGDGLPCLPCKGKFLYSFRIVFNKLISGIFRIL